MIGLLVVTHGRLAEELVEAAQRINPSPGMAAVSIGWDDDVEAARLRIEDSVRALEEGDGVLVLTDLFGGTAANISLSLLERGRVEVITGVNLAMLVKYTNLPEQMDLESVARKIADQGRRNIQVATQVLERRVEHAREEEG
jgi:PTS system mannose-specific IIA component